MKLLLRLSYYLSLSKGSFLIRNNFTLRLCAFARNLFLVSFILHSYYSFVQYFQKRRPCWSSLQVPRKNILPYSRRDKSTSLLFMLRSTEPHNTYLFVIPPIVWTMIYMINGLSWLFVYPLSSAPLNLRSSARTAIVLLHLSVFISPIRLISVLISFMRKHVILPRAHT